MMKRFLIIILIALTPYSVLASEFRDKEVSQYISNFCNDVIKTSLSKSKESVKLKKIIKVIDSTVNSKWISRFVLGKHFKSFDKDTFAKFQTLYRDYMINAYAPKFLSYKGKGCSVISVADQKLFFNVKTEFTSSDNPKPYEVSFRVKLKNDAISIIDFIPEGISLLESQRSELDSTISSLGVDGFMDDLRSKVDKLKKSNAASSRKG